MTRIVGLLIALSCSLSVSLQAQAESDYVRNGWYVGAYGAASSDLGWGGGFGFRSGYQTEGIAIEGEFMMLRYDGDRGSTLSSYQGNVNGKLLFGESRFQPYLIVGIGVIGGNAVGDTTWVLPVGGGVEYFATENITLALEGRGQLVDSSEASGLITFGIQYRY